MPMDAFIATPYCSPLFGIIRSGYRKDAVWVELGCLAGTEICLFRQPWRETRHSASGGNGP